MMQDKRITYASICGREYPMCLTVAAHQKIIDTYGGLQQMAEAMGTGEDSFAKIVPVARILMEGGKGRLAALAWMEGEEIPQITVPEEDVLRDVLDLADIQELGQCIFKAIKVSRGVTVEVQEEENTEKNADTTQE